MEGMSDRIKILRVGQLCGDATRGRGHWNEKEGWPLLIKTAELTGCLPVLSEVCNGLQSDRDHSDGTESIVAPGGCGCPCHVSIGRLHHPPTELTIAV